MLNKLVLNNFNSGFEPLLSEGHRCFIMQTCQRTLIISFDENPIVSTHGALIHDYLEGKAAYAYLLEIICGLKSKLIGENEIVGQFKEAYKIYAASNCKDSNLLQIIEKLFKDAKEIRSKYLLGLTQKTYSSIARKHIVSRNKAESVLILGSGQLAEDLINQFKKKTKVYISARNEKKVQQLALEHGLTILPWGDLNRYAHFPFITNSIGFKGVLLDEIFFESWAKMHKQKLFVDLGSPSAIQTSLRYLDGVMKLDDIFGEGAVHEDHKKNQLMKARKAMEGIVCKRHEVFRKKNLNNMYTPNKAKLAYV